MSVVIATAPYHSGDRAPSLWRTGRGRGPWQRSSPAGGIPLVNALISEEKERILLYKDLLGGVSLCSCQISDRFLGLPR